MKRRFVEDKKAAQLMNIFTFFARSMNPRRILLGIALCLALLGFSPVIHALDGAGQAESAFRIEAEPWEEAEKIFRSDSRWLGGDGASSVDLGHGRVLWLFGDSFIDLSGSGVRKADGFVRNSIAIQTGYDPSKARMQFFWKKKGTEPSGFFSLSGDHWFWPSSGIMVGKRLLIFLMEIQTAENDLGFDISGWKAVMIENPKKSPDQWRVIPLISPRKQSLIVGSGTPILEKGFLHVFAADSRDRAVYLVRWPESAALAGTLTAPLWWTGEKTGWVGPEDTGVKPQRIMEKGQMEFTVEYVPELKTYVQVQTLSIMNPCLALSTALSITGPWSSQTCFFAPPEQGVASNLIYAGKSHPMLVGADRVFTYVVNTTKEENLLKDMSIYFPILLKGCIRPIQ
ncbi:MAG: DUF4185 domain-containing protein [Desulfobacteraceae bacterium]|nr:DUF4185 domain-containing protein [Desulfobacteraceae bacterium]